MNSRDIDFYLRGIMNMASSASKSIGPSYVEVECYDKDEFLEEFKKNYRVTINIEELEKTDNNLKNVIGNWFYNEEKIAESIDYWFNLHLDNIENIYVPSVDTINEIEENKVNSYFYIIEDLIFVELKDKIIVFILGNNE